MNFADIYAAAQILTNVVRPFVSTKLKKPSKFLRFVADKIWRASGKKSLKNLTEIPQACVVPGGVFMIAHGICWDFNRFAKLSVAKRELKTAKVYFTFPPYAQNSP